MLKDDLDIHDLIIIINAKKLNTSSVYLCCVGRSATAKAMMKCFFLSFISFFILLSLCFHRVSSKNVSESDLQRASIPPRGWNSYDSFCWTISEEEFLENAEIVSQRLHDHGYEYVVVDYLWYRRKVEGAYHDSLGFDVIDEWGRMIPDPERSSHELIMVRVSVYMSGLGGACGFSRIRWRIMVH